MPVPFDFKKTNQLAAKLDSKLRQADEYRDDLWEDAALGPLLRLYALFTHYPAKAFEGPATEKQVCDCRVYIFARLSSLHQKRDGCDCLAIDAMDDLLTELDQIADADTFQAMKSGSEDASKQLAQLKKKKQAQPMEH